MEPLYTLLKSLDELISDWADEDSAMEKALLHYHDHVCWLSPTETLHSPRVRRMCKKFCKRNGVPKNPDYPKEYDCDNCPNLIIRYKYKNDFIAAFGNSYLYKKEGKME
jgi:hypothetical protein